MKCLGAETRQQKKRHRCSVFAHASSSCDDRCAASCSTRNFVKPYLSRKKQNQKPKHPRSRSRGLYSHVRHHSISRSHDRTRTFSRLSPLATARLATGSGTALCPGSSSTVPYRTGGPQGAGAVWLLADVSAGRRGRGRHATARRTLLVGRASSAHAARARARRRRQSPGSSRRWEPWAQSAR